MRDLDVYRTKTFTKWMRRSGLTDQALLNAVSEIEDGLVDADLGGALFKKRIAIDGKGKRSGARIIIATKFEDRWIFLFGFGKNERSNIDRNEMSALREIAAHLLAMSNHDLRRLVALRELTKVI